MSVEQHQQTTEPLAALEAEKTNGEQQIETEPSAGECNDQQTTECESMDTQQEPSGPVQQITEPVGPVQQITEPSGPVQQITEPSGPVQQITEPSGPVQQITEPSGPVQQITEPSGPAQEITTESSDIEEKKLFIGGLHAETTKESLRKYFEQFGKVELVELKTVKAENGEEYHRGFAFVTMDNKEIVEEILRKGREEEHVIDGKKVDCKQAMRHAAYQAKKTEQLKTKKVFVGGVPTDMEEDTIKEYFIVYGEIEEVAIVIDKVTRQRRGFVFVTYKDYESVDKLIEKSFHTIQGHQVEVKKAIPRDPAQGRGRPYRGGGAGRGGWQPYGGGGTVYSGYNDPYAYGGYADYGGGPYADPGFYGGGRGYGSRYGPMKGGRGAARSYHPYGR